MHNLNFAKTCIGSVPYTAPDKIVSTILENFQEIPFWPQLPKRSFSESMYVQYSENFPGMVADNASKKVFVDTSGEYFSGIETVLEKYLNDDVDFFAIGKPYAEGLYEFLSRKEELSSGTGKEHFLKGHVTGPFSFGLSVKDQSGKSAIFYREFEEIIPKFLGMKARWQARIFKQIRDKAVIFIDEPYLASLGSSYVPIDKDKAIGYINEMCALIKKENAYTGLHCCGNTEWGLLLNSDIDIISFDAYNFTDEFLLYHEDIKRFLSRGGVIAWGVVPTNEDKKIKPEPAKLVEIVDRAMHHLSAKGCDKKTVAKHSLVTPSCGMGTLDESGALGVIDLLGRVSEHLREKYE